MNNEDYDDDLIVIDEDNITEIAEIISEEQPCWSIETVLGFLQPLMHKELPFSEFIDYINGRIHEAVDEALMEMAMDGELEMSFDEKDGDFIFWVPKTEE